MAAGSVQVPNIVPLHLPNADVTLKGTITTDTLIDVKCGTEHTSIYYTLDGRQPDPFGGAGSANTTRLFTKPFTLPAGKTDVKALAVTRDGRRESRVVYRSYTVVPTENYVKSAASNAFNKQRMPANSIRRSRSAGRLPGRPLSGSSSIMTGADVDQSGTSLALTGSQVMSRAWASEIICPSCCAPRSKTAQSAFCPECGVRYPGVTATVPQTTPSANDRRRPRPPNTTPAIGSMKRCIDCQSYIPPSVESCVVCGASVHQMSTLNNSKQSVENKLECSTCKSENPAGFASCMVCEASLTGAKSKTSVFKDPNAKSRCVGCGAMSTDNVKFCGKCGSLMPRMDANNCPQCNSLLLSGSKFCPGCGALVSTVPSLVVASTNTLNSVSTIDSFLNTSLLNKNQKSNLSRPVAIVPASNPRRSENLPAHLASGSPGGGYWRQQLTYISHHLKLFAQENKDFQSSVSESKLGKLANAKATHVDGVLRVSLEFEISKDVASSREGVKTGTASRYFEAAKQYTIKARESRSRSTEGAKRRSRSQSRASSGRSQASSSRSAERLPDVSSVANRSGHPVRHTTPTRTLSEETENLLKELQMPEQDLEAVEHLIEVGADVNARTEGDAVPALALAVRHGFADALAPLIQHGADVNVVYGRYKQTVLHEAVLMGPSAKSIVEILLRSGINAEAKTTRGDTAQSMAIKKNYLELVDLIAAHVSEQLLLG